MEPTNPALAKAMAMANVQQGPAFSGEFEEYCSTWMTATITEDNTPEVKIKELSEGHTYRFRVKAVNAAGPSWPSMPTDEIVCKVIYVKKVPFPVHNKRSLSFIINDTIKWTFSGFLNSKEITEVLFIEILPDIILFLRKFRMIFWYILLIRNKSYR